MKKFFVTACCALGLSLLSGAALPERAAAQSYYDYFGGGWSQQGRLPKQTVSLRAPYRSGTIIVSFADRRLYRMTGRGTAISYPIATPRDISRWSGTLRVSRKAVNPTWTPTARMRRENPKLPVTVRGGDPRNPLGTRALYLGSTLYRIHGTDAPWTIGKNVSKGCIRMYNAHVEELYNMTRTGTRVVVTWKKYRPRATFAFAATRERPRRRGNDRFRNSDVANFFAEAFGQ